MSADNVTLLAFAADCHADVDMDQKAATSAADVPCSNRSISPMYRAHSSKPATLLQQLMNETDRQTDGHTPQRYTDPATYYVSTVDNHDFFVTEK